MGYSKSIPFRVNFGVFQVHSRSIWGSFGAFGAIWKYFGGVFQVSSRSKHQAVSGPFWGTLGLFYSGAVLGSTLGPFQVCFGHLEAVWGSLGTFRCVFCSLWGNLCPFLRHLGQFGSTYTSSSFSNPISDVPHLWRPPIFGVHPHPWCPHCHPTYPPSPTSPIPVTFPSGFAGSQGAARTCRAGGIWGESGTNLGPGAGDLWVLVAHSTGGDPPRRT